MNDTSMYISTEKLNGVIARIKQEDSDMSNLFEVVKTQMANIDDYWIGLAAEANRIRIKELYEKFEIALNENKKYINFLEKVVNPSYTSSDQNTSNYIDSNINVE